MMRATLTDRATSTHRAPDSGGTGTGTGTVGGTGTGTGTVAGTVAGQANAGVTLGLCLQLGLLAVLSAITELHTLGWVAGSAVGLGTWALLGSGLRRAGARSLGPANQVTLARTILVGGIAALAAESFTHAVPVPVIVTLTGVALLLDGVDGQVARRTGSSSALGARFDMEVDAFLILVLSALLVRPLGPWVLAIGGMRYVFVLAGLVLPWLTAPLPPRFSRKVVAALQGTALVVAVSGVLPRTGTLLLVQAALAALCWSFGRDVRWLIRAAAPTADGVRVPTGAVSPQGSGR